MKKTDKKIISIFLVLIILISQISPIIFAEEDTTNLISLEQYLVENGVDENQDGKISDEEWKSIKNLGLYGNEVDITGIEKAINLKRLYIRFADLSGMDFGKFKNLKELRLSYCTLENTEIVGLDNLTSLDLYNTNLNSCKIENLKNLEEVDFQYTNIEGFDFSKIKNVKEIYIFIDFVSGMDDIDLDLTALKNLKSLRIYDLQDKINSLNVSGLSNLKVFDLWGRYDCNIEFSGLNNIEEIDIRSDKIDKIDLTNYEKLKKISIRQSKKILDIKDIDMNQDFIAYVDDGGSWYYDLILEKKENVIEIPKNGIIDIEEEFGNFSLNLPETDRLELDSKNGNLIAKNIGEEEIKFIDDLKREHEILIKVVEKNLNTDLDNLGITAKPVNDDWYNKMILKSNGELWEINSATTAEIIDTNVRKYVSNDVYYVNTLYNDNKLVVEYLESDRKIVENVKDIGELLYVTTDGKLYEYEIEYATEELKTKYVMDNVKKVINGNFVILENGKTFKKKDGEYVKLFDVEIKEYISGVFNECNNDDRGWVDIVIDINDNKWINPNENWRKVNEKDNLEDIIHGCYLSLSKNKTAHLIYWGKSEDEILKSPLVLTDVEHMKYINSLDLLIRTDGSIWLYDLRNGLTKITESTSIKGEEEKLTINFNDVSEKNGIISDIELGTTIEDLKEKIQTNGEIKVYTKDGVSIETNEKLATGMKVEISLGNEKLFYTIAIEGDCNGDGKVRVGDLTTMMVSVAENLASNKDTSKILDGAWKQAVDFNGDGKLNVSDITKLKILIAESK